MRLETSSTSAVPVSPAVREGERSDARLWTTPLKRALLITALWRVLIAIAGSAAYFVMPRGKFTAVSLIRQYHWPVNPFSLVIDSGVRSDAAWYARIALHGYSYSTQHKSSIAFYPLYPLLIKLFSFVSGNVWVAGMLISTLCLFGAIVLLYLWLQAFGLERHTPRATLLLLLFPPSLFFAAMYSESLYLLLALATFVCFERRLWAGATLSAFLLTLCRPTGILIAPCLLLMLRQRRERNWRAYAAPVASVAALLAFAGYQYIAFGTPLATEHAQAMGPWYRSLHQGLSDVTLHRRPGVPPWFLAMLLLVGLGFLATVPRVYRRFGAPYALFTALSVIVPAATGLISLERFVIVDFPVFAAFAQNPVRKRTVILLTIELWLLILLTMGYAAGWSVW